MSESDDRVQWAQVSGVPELWASESGEVATLAPGGGFDVLDQYTNDDGKPYIYFTRGDRPNKGKRSVARLVLAAFVERRGSAQPITYADGDVSNCRRDNLSWRRRSGRGGPVVGNCTPRRCLGDSCGHATFLSTGPANRICPVCTTANARMGHEVDGVHEPGEIPDAPLLSPPLGVVKG